MLLCCVNLTIVYDTRTFMYFNFFCAKTLMSEPEEIATMTGQKIPRKCSIGKYCFRIRSAVCVSYSSDSISHGVYGGLLRSRC